MRGLFKFLTLCASVLTTPGWAILFSPQVTGLNFVPTPNRFVIGDTGTLTMRCNVNEADVKKVYDITIKRESAPGANSERPLASIDVNNDAARLDDGTSEDKDFEVIGSLTDIQPYLQVSMNIQKMTCSDARMYKCQSVYLSNTDSARSPTLNATLEAFVLPVMMGPLEAKKNGDYVLGGDSTLDKAPFDVGDQLELTCRANIGSRQSTRIQWRKSSEINDHVFNQYNPAANMLQETDAVSDNQCGYTRTSTLHYNVTASDAAYNLVFECYVEVTRYPTSTVTPGGRYETQNNLRYYLNVASSTTPKSGTGTAAPSTNPSGAVTAGNATKCNDLYTSYGKYCYALLPVKASWIEALQYCKAFGGTLAVIENGVELQFVEGLLKGNRSNILTNQIWIGGTDLLQEGQWVAPGTLTPLNFFNWAPSEPDYRSGQHCLAIYNNGDYKWGDSNCEVLSAALCKAGGNNNDNPAR